ncbi:MAG: aldehyde:ferredoxin oxidoreductase [Gammaproteobacteria bacterium]|nr:aldehyde:ferredoxin oxidoreductase [Gammaproteobacteria bacterium]
MLNLTTNAAHDPSKVKLTRCTVDLATGAITLTSEACRNLEDILGGFGRSFQLLAERDVDDAYADNNPLIVNLGLFTGTSLMTGLRVYFSAYSPLKHSNTGKPAAIWSTGSDKFGPKLKWAGIDEIVFEGKSPTPVMLVVRGTERGPEVHLEAADSLLGLHCHDKHLQLKSRFDDAYFAVIGPAGENYRQCAFGAIALSTENQFKSGDDKCRWAGRGGMGSVMGSKNLIGIVAQVPDHKEKISKDLQELNKLIVTGPGSRKFREKKKGGLGGTWSNYEPLQAFNFVPQNNFRPAGDGKVELLFRDRVEPQFTLKAESCFKCAIACHKNVYEQAGEHGRGAFLAKFDYEPLNLLSTNLGIHDPRLAADLISLVDKLGMDSITIGVTIGYVLDFNTRYPERPILNEARFGDYAKVRELILATGEGRCPEIGQGVKRLGEWAGDPSFAMHVKGLELPAYQPDTNPGYAWAIAGGHMSMATYMLLALEKDTSLDYWVKAITERGLYFVREDMTGACKFAMMDITMLTTGIEVTTGLKVEGPEVLAAVRRAFLRGLALELKQGYSLDEYTLPSQIFDDPNPVLKTEPFITREFFEALRTRVWACFTPEIAAL